MKRLFATLGICAALASVTAPAYAQGPGDPSGTNCDEIASLAAGGVPAGAISSIAGTTTGASSDVKIQTHFPPVTFTGTSEGCSINVNPHP
jgi:hypothetical protein